MADASPERISCATCGQTPAKVRAKKDGAAALPPGWKVLGGRTLCQECRRRQFVVRSLVFPVQTCTSHPWGDFTKALLGLWAQSTALANWAVTEFAKAETAQLPGDGKLLPMSRPKLYPEARRLFPQLDSTTTATILDQT